MAPNPSEAVAYRSSLFAYRLLATAYRPVAYRSTGCSLLSQEVEAHSPWTGWVYTRLPCLSCTTSKVFHLFPVLREISAVRGGLVLEPFVYGSVWSGSVCVRTLKCLHACVRACASTSHVCVC
jgi:hypothetical protein